MSTSDSALGLDDTLEALGLATAAFLVVVGLATLVGMPWTTGGLLPGLTQSLGAVFAVVVGAAIAWIARE